MSVTSLVPEIRDWHCPTWCHNQHEEAVKEGCGESAGCHYSPQALMRLDEIRNVRSGDVMRGGQGHAELRLVAEPGEDQRRGGYPLIRLEARRSTSNDPRDCERVTLDLTTGEARSLARQLSSLADLEDLEDLR